MKVAVLGSGAMGSGIAQVAASAGEEVYLFDNKAEALVKAQKNIQYFLNRSVEKGKLEDADAKAIFGRISFIEKIESIADAGLVIEAIVENLEVKQKVFSFVDELVKDYCILASNTSSLSITEIAAVCQKPERFLGLHFFNPAPLMKLVEIVPAIQTDSKYVETATKLMERWGKYPVVAKDTPGFIVNRIARPFYSEALRIYEEGFADPATIDWAMTEIGGFRMGPFSLMDYIGHDVNYTVTETVWKAFYFDPRYKPSFTQLRLSQAGYLGRKSGKGFYDYIEGVTNPIPNKDRELGENIFWRILVMLINEAADALYLNIASKEDIETAMTKGVNYPKGLLAWADEKGIEHCVDTLDRLYAEYHEDRYRCSPQLRQMKKRGDKFFT